MKTKTMLKHVQTIDNSLVEIYQEILALQVELKDVYKTVYRLSKSKKAQEEAREYYSELLKRPKA